MSYLQDLSKKFLGFTPAKQAQMARMPDGLQLRDNVMAVPKTIHRFADYVVASICAFAGVQPAALLYALRDAQSTVSGLREEKPIRAALSGAPTVEANVATFTSSTAQSFVPLTADVGYFADECYIQVDGIGTNDQGSAHAVFSGFGDVVDGQIFALSAGQNVIPFPTGCKRLSTTTMITITCPFASVGASVGVIFTWGRGRRDGWESGVDRPTFDVLTNPKAHFGGLTDIVRPL